MKKKHILSLLAVFLLVGSYSNEAAAKECDAGNAVGILECYEAIESACLKDFSCNYARCTYPTNQVIRRDCDHYWNMNRKVDLVILEWMLQRALTNLAPRM